MRSFRRRTLLAIAALTVLVAAPTPVSALVESTAEPARVMLVLDASGSMWGEVEGRPKIAIAREVVADLLARWDPAIPLGVMAYGHRRQGDCTDIETVVPVAPVKAPAIAERVGGLTPTGESPLSAAVRLAAQQLDYADGNATVILVSDGEESCNEDPCAVGADLESGGVGFTGHVIGFGLTSEQAESLRCLAENTGGLFLTARDAAGLSRALDQALEQVKETVPPGVILTATMTEEGGPITERVWFYVFELREDGRRGKQLFYQRSGAAFFELPTGSYLVEARLPSPQGPAIARRAIEVDDGKAQHFVVNLRAGTLALDTVFSDGGRPLEQAPWYSVLEAEPGARGKRRQLWREKRARPEVVLGAGRYRVEVRYPKPDGPARASSEVEIRENERSEQAMNLHAGVLALSAVLKEGAAPLKKESWYAIFPSGAPGRERDKLWKERRVKPEVVLSAGRYRVEAAHPDPNGPARAVVEVEVRENQRTEQVMNFSAGRFVLNAEQDGKPVEGRVFFEIFEPPPSADARRERIFFERGQGLRVLLSAGRYIVRARLESAEGEVEITVTPGEKREVTVPIAP